MALSQFAIEHDRFADSDEADRLAQQSHPHTTRFDIESVNGAMHWHNFDATLYLVSGELSLAIRDPDQNDEDATVHQVVPGMRVHIPAGTLHAERSDGYAVLLGSDIAPSDFEMPIDRQPEALAGFQRA